MEHTAIVWFRNDLRLHDNEALTEAIQKAKNVVPVYVFDDRIFNGKTSLGFKKTGKFRAKFIIESVANLRKNLRALGSDLIIRVGKPEDEVYKIAREIKSSWVYCNRERTSEEVAVQDALENKLWTIGQELRYVRGKMLFHTADLPFPVSQVPDTFTVFRKEVENTVRVRLPFDSPKSTVAVDDTLNRGELPSIQDFGHDDYFEDHIENKKFLGGEDEAIKQLDYYLFESKLIAQYKETRNEMLGWDFSSKLSAWLAHGCISPKTVYHTIKKFETNIQKNESTYWLVFELMWRDYFRLMGKKYGNKIFQSEGIRGKVKSYKNDSLKFNLWANGETGITMIDANMKQLNATGFMSNRGRQNVASFLVNDLNLHWLLGAEYFESLLIDYDPCSNYCNWNYLAGIGNDPREDRYFNIISQSKRYDPNGDFIRYWLPQLSKLPANFVHQPDLMSINDQAHYKVVLGKTYPQPIISSKHWSK
jgi:deoxyribodipyrimidine photo-lyase